MEDFNPEKIFLFQKAVSKACDGYRGIIIIDCPICKSEIWAINTKAQGLQVSCETCGIVVAK